MKRHTAVIAASLILALAFGFAASTPAEAEPEPEIIERVKYVYVPIAQEAEPEPVYDVSVEAAIEDERIVIDISADTVALLAKMAWGEARGEDDTRIAATVWCALNRVDAGFEGGDLQKIITRPMQFTGYKASNPVDEHIAEIVTDVLIRWQLERLTGYSHGRVLPSEYLYFASKGAGNVFRTAYKGGDRWDWSLPSPYGT